MSAKGNRVLTGTNGEVYINGELLSELMSIELKVKGNFEDVIFCGDFATHKKYVGWEGEGSIKLQKVQSRGLKLLGNAYLTGIMPAIKIVTKLTDVNTKKSERVSVEDVTIEEFTLTMFEAKKLTEEELPIKFAKYNVIETI
jgi:hypothetical protein